MANITSTKYIISDMLNAPTLSGTVGDLANVLDACLVDGFACQTISSIAVSAGTGTITFSAAHSLQDHCVVTLSGCTTTALNADWRLTYSSATVMTFDATGIGDEDPVAGAPVATVTPLGWNREDTYTSTNERWFYQEKGGSNERWLHVNDNLTSEPGLAEITGYESVSAGPSGSGQFPLATWLKHWTKSSAANTNVNGWKIIGDGRSLFIWIDSGDGAGNPLSFAQIQYAMDIESINLSDAYSFILSTGNYGASHYYYNTNSSFYCQGSTSSQQIVFPRSYSQAAPSGSSPIARYSVNAAQYLYLGGDGGPPYPMPGSGDFHFQKVQVWEGAWVTLRGFLSGLYNPMHDWNDLTNGEIITGVSGFSGRKFIVLICRGSSERGAFVVDITGPWSY